MGKPNSVHLPPPEPAFLIGIDVHKNESQICILTQTDEVLELRITTRHERFAEVLGDRPRARVLIEASTESEWVARCLEELGHEVVVADPNFAPMYATRTRKVKTDRRDARALAEACRLGAYRRAHRTTDGQRRVRARLAVREALVRTRTGYVSLARALLRQHGQPVGTGTPERFAERVERLSLPGQLLSEVAPLLAIILQLNKQIAFLDALIEEVGRQQQSVRLIRSVPSIGPVTAVAFVAALDDDASRFRGAHQVESYLGLVPREMSSGEVQRKGRITKTGDGRVRWLLVQAAVSILGLKKPETAVLRTWAERIALRRGRKTAVVALARRLAGILYAMMRDGTIYNPTPAHRSVAAPTPAAAA
ncbi:MAG TPA: IS110 family transposase [Anaeromyxobacteraceae bacterium]|nr:IS110 family transposase [Anaeromyxobacteraceae bacterium]